MMKSPVQSFVSVHSAGLIPRLRFRDFHWLITWLYCIFCWARDQEEPVD